MSLIHYKVSILILAVCLCRLQQISGNSLQSSQANSASFYGSTHAVHTPPSTSLHVCLQFTPSQGTLLTAHTHEQNTSLQLTLSSNSLVLTLSDEPLLLLSLTEATQEWLTTELDVNQDSVSLTLEGESVEASLQHALNLTELTLGGDPSTDDRYVGCLSNVSVNSQPVQFPDEHQGGYNIGCCVPPRGSPSSVLGLFNHSLWEQISVRHGMVTVDEGSNVTLTATNLQLTVPSNLIGYWLQSDLENRLMFDVLSPPKTGYFTRGMSQISLDRFHYRDLASNDPLSEIVFRHNGMKRTDDSAVLRAHFECKDSTQGPWSQEFTLPLVIIERNDPPYILKQRPLSIAVGTRVVLTSSVVTVADRETLNASKILYAVEYVRVMDDCELSLCQDHPAGQMEWADGPGGRIAYFTQEDINQQKVAFQHFTLHGNRQVTIGLRAQDSNEGGNTVRVKLIVDPFPGSIWFTPLLIECTFLEVGHQTILTSSYLNVTTNFQHQSPTITYDILSAPVNGRLEVYEPIQDKWSLVNETIYSRRSRQPVFGHFTQSDVDNDHVRYTHNGNDSESSLFERIDFKLRSSQFTDPFTLDFCFHVLTSDFLIQPEFLVQVSNLTVSEGASALVDPTILEFSLSEKLLLYSPFMTGVDIRITDLEPIILLETPPLAGNLTVRGHNITAGSNFSLVDLQGGEVYYHHGGDELHSDMFGVSIHPTVDVPLIIQPHPSDIITVSVVVSPVNNHEPVYTSRGSIMVTEGSFVKITSAHILVEDRDLPGDQLKIFLRKARKPEDTRTGIFAFMDAPDVEIKFFFMEDVLNERVIFSHTLNESAALNFKQVLRISDGEHTLTPKPQIEVIAVPHTLTVRLSTAPCIHSLDLTESPKLTLDYEQFTFVMIDRHGENSNLILEVSVSLGKSPLHGQLYKTTDGSQSPVSRFTVSDLLMGRIQYQFTSTDEISHARSDQFELIFRYGHSTPDPIPVHICINPIPIIDVVRVQTPTVSQEGMFVLNATYLWANNTRGEDGDTISYEISNPPDWGEIIHLNGHPLRVFTQADVNQGRVFYERFSNASDQQDSVTFRVCTVVELCTEERTLLIDVDFINITIVNTGIWVKEGGSVAITARNLSGTVPEGFRQVRYFLQENFAPRYGQILVDYGPEGLEVPTFFDTGDIEQGTVYYENDGREQLNDTFVVIARSSMGNRNLAVEILVKIFIIPVNDHAPQIIIKPEPLQVAQGGTVQIHSDILRATDLDSDVEDGDLIYSIHPPLNGYMYLDTDPGDHFPGVFQWTQRDINEGRLYYKNTDQDDKDVVIYRVDENLQEAAKVARNDDFFSIDISEIIFEPSTIPPSPFRVDEGANKTITSDHLSYVSTNDVTLRDEEIVYHIVNVSNNGELLLESIPVKPGDMFTQRKIVEGKLTYQHDHSNTKSDKFTFTLGDNNNRMSNELFTFRITVQVVDDDHPTVVVANPVLVVEQSQVTLNSDIIQVTDRDSVRGPDDRDNIRCTITVAPLYGVLQTARFGAPFQLTRDRFTMYDIAEQSFRYLNTLVGHANDSFKFEITDGTNQSPQNYTVEILILPETVELDVGSVTVDEDSYASLQSWHFLVLHEFLSTVPGTIFVLDGPYNGRLTNREVGEVSNFTTNELEQGLIRYEHGGAENSLDNFTFVYHSHDPQGLNRNSERLIFEVIVAPNNDQVPVLDPNRELILELWAKEKRRLDRRYFNTTDKDTSAYFLRYHVPAQFPEEFDWFISYVNDTTTPIYTFTQQEVDEGRVVFVHHTDQDSVLRYNVTDGEFNTTGNLTIKADPLGLNCNVSDNPWLPITVEQNSAVVITEDNLLCTTNDRENEREIIYHVTSVQHGQFYDGDKATSVFTNRDLENGVVKYRHTDLDRWESVDPVQMTIENEFEMEETYTVNIAINLPVTEGGEAAINNKLQVTEGEVACLNESHLDARNVRYEYWRNLSEAVRPRLSELDVYFNLTVQPKTGYLVFSEDGERGEEILSGFSQSDLANGTVCYQHDNSETLEDSFQFTLSVVGPSMPKVYRTPDMFSITILPINDLPPVLNTTNPSVELVAGFKHNLSQDDLLIVDGDSLPRDIHIVLHSVPENAQLILGNRTLSEGDTFTQEHINNGTVSMLPVEVDISEVFTFSFQDELYNSSMHQFQVLVVPHTLEVLGEKVITYQQNETRARITNKSLRSVTNAGQNLTTFTITRQPKDGFLARKDLSRVVEFTQTDVNDEQVSYIAKSGSRQHRDSFAVSVKNSNSTVQNVEVSVRVLVWGKVKDSVPVSFEEDSKDYSYQLPVDTLVLNQGEVHLHPEILLLEPPKYGHLDLQFTRKRSIEKRQTDTFTFNYDDLTRGWVYYVWDYDRPVDAPQVQDSFMLLINSSNSRPGEAYVELTVTPPSIATKPPPTVPTTTQESSNTPSETESESTPSPSEANTALIMVAIFAVLVIVLIAVIIVLFCCTQQKRIRRKLHLITSTPPPNPTLPLGSPSSPSRHMAPQFNFDLHVDGDNHSLSSGFSEDGELPPLRSPLRSPTHSHAFSYSPPHPAHTIPSPTYTADRPLSRRPRVLSNVSITLSGRQSMLSEASMEDPSHLYSHSLPRPPPLDIAVPIPVRPASQVAVRANTNGESGYNSYTHTVANSSLSVEESESTGGEFPSALDDDHMTDLHGHVTELPDQVTELKVVSGKTTNEEMEEGEGIHKILDLNDPNVLRLFRSTHPVLKKQEYWF